MRRAPIDSGFKKQRDGECSNQVWHTAKEFAAQLGDQIVADMAESYKLFQREHMAARLKRAVIRKAHPLIVEVFEGVQEAKYEAEREKSTKEIKSSSESP